MRVEPQSHSSSGPTRATWRRCRGASAALLCLIASATTANAQRETRVPLVSGLTIVSALHFPDGDRENVVVVSDVVGSGPYAGTYRAPTDEVVCLYVKKQPQFTVSYKNFSPNGAKAFAEGGMTVDNPEETGARRGRVLITFGSSDKPRFYDVSVPGPGTGPITLKRSGTHAELAYQGKTSNGVDVRVTATCSDIDQM